eukprot:CAMPEP_0179096262 /NCGR_PEP_ID=MMETSP0796-20121207/44245_1 /TAXON_ID=73915 /ORGANISM="Pyrodinium bahamense, Strain pbaha01" /LENGTH=142 /DNA_ID=CAMNT_0020793979 /DNA_START=55 /DNA_END=481 /DNA_ORIENTATION=-
MRRIAEVTGAKIRIRGRGSGHLEIDGKSEAPTPLMVAVTTDKVDEAGFRAAIEAVLKELRSTEQRFRAFCEKQHVKHEGPCFSIGLLPDAARSCLGAIFQGVPEANSGGHARSSPETARARHQTPSESARVPSESASVADDG